MSHTLVSLSVLVGLLSWVPLYPIRSPLQQLFRIFCELFFVRLSFNLWRYAKWQNTNHLRGYHLHCFAVP